MLLYFVNRYNNDANVVQKSEFQIQIQIYYSLT